MKLRRSQREEPDINLTPLIDVVFLLLIFFMVSTTFDRDAELTIDLPEATAETVERKPDTVEISIDAQGRYYVNGRELVNTQAATVKLALSKLAGVGDPPLLVISADASTAYQSVIAVMDAARQLGFVNLSFPVQVTEEQSSN